MKKITNMESGVEIELYSLWDIARKTGLNQYKLQEIIDDETTETPKPAFRISDTDYWFADAADEFTKLVQEDREKDLESTFTKAALIEKGKAMIKRHGLRNYERKIDYREAYKYVEGIHDFLVTLTSYGIPDEQNQEMTKIIRTLRSNAGL